MRLVQQPASGTGDVKLDGIKVLDLSQFLPGPHLTMTMADHGANVLMVEPKNGIGEPVRAMGARTPDGISVWFRNIARGKRSVVLDLKDPGDKAAFLKLAEDADVIVEAFRPGVVKRLGIDYDMIAARNPLFDNWDWPLTLIGVFTSGLVLIFIGIAVLQREAQTARASALDCLDAALLH